MKASSTEGVAILELLAKGLVAAQESKAKAKAEIDRLQAIIDAGPSEGGVPQAEVERQLAEQKTALETAFAAERVAFEEAKAALVQAAKEAADAKQAEYDKELAEIQKVVADLVAELEGRPEPTPIPEPVPVDPEAPVSPSALAKAKKLLGIK